MKSILLHKNPTLFSAYFAEAFSINYIIDSTSPCINSGIIDITGLFLPDYDIAGNLRIDPTSNTIDMGAYEYLNFPQSMQVSGIVSEDTFWGSDTIKVVGNITIPDSVSLTIFSGVQVLFLDDYLIDVYGNLNAFGCEINPIIFQPEVDSIGWNGIRFNDSENNESTLTYCNFMYGKADQSGNYSSGGAIYIDSYKNLTIKSCR